MMAEDTDPDALISDLSSVIGLMPDPRLIVASPSSRWGRMLPNGRPHWIAHGGQHIYTYKTYRNALARATNEGAVVLQLDLSLLPIVDNSKALVTKGPTATEAQFAERQMMLWAERADALSKVGR
jgi:hypothetical protein